MGKKHRSDKEDLRDRLAATVADAAEAANAEFRDAGEAVRDATEKGAGVARHASKAAQTRARDGVAAMRRHRRRLLALSACVISAATATTVGLVALRPGRSSQS